MYDKYLPDIVGDFGFWLVLVCMEFLVLAQGFLAGINGFLTPKDMREERGIRIGLPFLGHGGMYGDFFIVTPIICCLISRYAQVFTEGKFPGTNPFLGAALIALVVTIVANAVWVLNSKEPGGSGVHADSGRLTAAGMFHAIYMVIALPVLICYYFHVPNSNIPVWEVVTISIALAFHSFIGFWHPWPKVFKSKWWGGSLWSGTWETVIIWIALSCVTWNIVANRSVGN